MSMQLYDTDDAGGARLVLVGEFDVRSTGEVRAAIYDRLRASDLVVDLSGVGSIDLVALRVLAVATRAARRGGRRLTLAGCGPAVRRMLHLSHLAHHVVIEPARVYQP